MEMLNTPTLETDKKTTERLVASAVGVETRGEKIMQLIKDINENRETKESAAIRDKTVEMLGDGHDYSPFATTAYSHDTMFLWTVVTLAERFCHLYNAVNNPIPYYREIRFGVRRGPRQLQSAVQRSQSRTRSVHHGGGLETSGVRVQEMHVGVRKTV